MGRFIGLVVGLGGWGNMFSVRIRGARLQV